MSYTWYLVVFTDIMYIYVSCYVLCVGSVPRRDFSERTERGHLCALCAALSLLTRPWPSCPELDHVLSCPTRAR